TVPAYNQTTAVTVLTRCNCDLDGSAVSATNSVTSTPGTCTPVTAGIINNTGTTVLTCSTTNISLTATGGDTYAWSGGLGSSANATVTAAGTYTVTVTGTNGCTATASITITGNASPTTAGITNNTGTTVLTCTTTSISLTATGGGTYLWSGGLGISANATVTAAGTYTVTVTSTNGCTATADITITGSGLTPTILSTTATPNFVCQGGSSQLSARILPKLIPNSNVGFIDISSTGTSVGTVSDDSEHNITMPAFTFNGITYTNARVSPNGIVVLGATTGDINFSNQNLPINNFGTAGSIGLAPWWDDLYPNSNTAIFTQTIGNIFIIQWHRIGHISLPSTGEITFQVQLNTVTGEITFVYNDVLFQSGAGQNSGGSATVGIQLNSSTAVLYSFNTQSLVDGQSISFIQSLPSYAWSPAAGLNNASIANPIAGNITATTTYTVTVTDTATGCSTTSSTTVTPPQYTASAAAPLVCAGGNTSLTASIFNPAAEITVTISATAFLDETTWNLTDALGNIIASGGPYLYGSTNSAVVTSANLPLTFFLETQGSFNDNTPNYTILYNGVVYTSGILTGGQTFTLSNIGGNSNISYLWSPATFLDDVTSATPNVTGINQTTTYTVTITNSSGSGCSGTASTTVGVFNNATSISGNTVYCEGGTINLTAAAGGIAYAWSGPGGYTQNGATVSRSNATPLMSGTYTVTVSTGNGCLQTGSVVVTVNAAPVANITAFGSTTFCAGGSVLLTASGGNSYQWSNGLTSASITAISSGIYTVTVTNGNGCTGTASQSVTVNPVPSLALTALGATAFCQGGSVSLKATAAGTFLWSTGSTSNLIVATTSGTYTVTVTNSFGCTNSASQTVTVNPLPTAAISASGATSFCAGGSVTLTAGGGSTYLWNTGATSAAITVGTSGTYVVTVTNAFGCTATASRTVTVTPVPAAAITTSGATTFCAGGLVTLTASGGGTYQWSTGAGVASITTGASGTYTVTVTSAGGCTATASRTVTVVSTTAAITASGPTNFCSGGSVMLTASGGGTYQWSTGSSNAAITVTTSGTYVVTVSNLPGCTATASRTVTVSATPVATASNNGPLCSGSSLQLTASGGGTGYTWSGPGSFASTMQNPIRTNATTTMSGTYTVTVTGSGGCTATASTTATVNAKPVAAITGNAANCANATITLTASGGTGYTWSGPGGYTATGATITRSPATTAMAGTYTVTVSNASGCTALASKIISVSAAPSASVGGTSSVCEGGSIVLTGFGGTAYSWLGPDGYIGSGSSINRTNVTTAMGGLYTVTVTGLTGCTATASKTVTVNPAPLATASSNSPACVNGIINLYASGGVSYSWTGPSAFSSTLQNPSRAKVTYLMGGTYTVTVTGTNGCTATAGTPVSVVSCKTYQETASIELTAYPNPTNSQTTVAFASPKTENIRITVYDVTGREINELFNMQAEANTLYELELDMEHLSSGTYYALLRTESGEQQQIRLMVVR
ncbi:hypothetical protein C7N43_32150, partial [Sphingobacteriales bacterium UPWRP_1]